MDILSLQNITKTYPNSKFPAISDFDMILKKGKILAIVGESGSGKTTLSRLIAGLETPDKGTIVLNNIIVASNNRFIEPDKRSIGMVFQDYALFPHLTVKKNIAYGISKDKDKKKRVLELLELVKLNGLETRYPHQLSGGQQQRVALARALAPKPELLILDEPFSNLDASLKSQLRQDLFEIITQTNISVLFITHDTDDAMAVSDTIAIIRNGKIVQSSAIKTVRESPKNNYVASLFKK